MYSFYFGGLFYFTYDFSFVFFALSPYTTSLYHVLASGASLIIFNLLFPFLCHLSLPSTLLQIFHRHIFNFEELFLFTEYLFLFFKRFYLFIFRQRGREGQIEGNISGWLPLECPILGTWPAIQACALTRNRTDDRLVCSPCSVHWAIPVRAEY